MLPDLKSVIRLQELDNRITELTHEISALPKHIAEIEKKLVSHQRKLDADRAALTANQKERKRMDSEIQAQEQKISKLRDQMLLAKTNEQYRAFQNEIEFCQKEIRKAEDRILELMGESDPLEKAVKAAEESLKAEKAEVMSEQEIARKRTAEDKTALERLHGERKEILAGLNPSVYRKYENIRKHRAGIAVAEAADGRCTACHMAMRLQYFQDVRKCDQILVCESCGRILYFNPPVAVEDLTGEPVPTSHE